MRAGTFAEGLPLDPQVIAEPWRDDVALAVALEFDRALGDWRPPPL